MAITREKIIESMHKCALAGDWEFEATLVEKIAKQLRRYQSGESLHYTKPPSFGEIRKASGAVAPDEQGDHYNRPDIVLSNRRGRPICVIEVKRIWNKGKCYEDLERVYRLVDACSHRNGGSLRRGFLLVGRMSVRREIIDQVIEDIEGYSKENFRDMTIRLEVRRSSSLSIEISA